MLSTRVSTTLFVIRQFHVKKRVPHLIIQNSALQGSTGARTYATMHKEPYKCNEARPMKRRGIRRMRIHGRFRCRYKKSIPQRRATVHPIAMPMYAQPILSNDAFAMFDMYEEGGNQLRWEEKKRQISEHLQGMVVCFLFLLAGT